MPLASKAQEWMRNKARHEAERALEEFDDLGYDLGNPGHRHEMAEDLMRLIIERRWKKV